MKIELAETQLTIKDAALSRLPPSHLGGNAHAELFNGLPMVERLRERAALVVFSSAERAR